jgi:trans-aconitate 2-methyltransferase
LLPALALPEQKIMRQRFFYMATFTIMPAKTIVDKNFFIFILTSLILITPFTHSADVPPSHVWDGSSYEKNSTPQFRWALQALSALDRNMVENCSHILDLGCGIGDLAAVLADIAPQASIIGIDISPSMIAKAQEKHENQARLLFESYGAHALPESYTEHFDCIISTNAFHWMRDQQQVLNTITRCLNPGGIVLIDTSALPTNDILDPTFAALIIVSGRQYWAPFFTADSFKSSKDIYLVDTSAIATMISRAGLTLLKLQKDITLTTTFADKQQFIEWLTPIVQTYTDVDSLTHEQQELFIREVVDEYLRNYPMNDDGSVSYFIPHNALIIAKK